MRVYFVTEKKTSIGEGRTKHKEIEINPTGKSVKSADIRIFMHFLIVEQLKLQT